MYVTDVDIRMNSLIIFHIDGKILVLQANRS